MPGSSFTGFAGKDDERFQVSAKGKIKARTLNLEPETYRGCNINSYS
jgi:hypothetical protein